MSIISPAPASRVGRPGGSVGCVALMDFSARLMQCQAVVLLFRVTEGSSVGQSRGLMTPRLCPQWAFHLRVGLSGPCGSLPAENILVFFNLCALQVFASQSMVNVTCPTCLQQAALCASPEVGGD